MIAIYLFSLPFVTGIQEILKVLVAPLQVSPIHNLDIWGLSKKLVFFRTLGGGDLAVLNFLKCVSLALKTKFLMKIDKRES